MADPRSRHMRRQILEREIPVQHGKFRRVEPMLRSSGQFPHVMMRVDTLSAGGSCCRGMPEVVQHRAAQPFPAPGRLFRRESINI
jgi:hypothetical protein